MGGQVFESDAAGVRKIIDQIRGMDSWNEDDKPPDKTVGGGGASMVIKEPPGPGGGAPPGMPTGGEAAPGMAQQVQGFADPILAPSVVSTLASVLGAVTSASQT